MFSPKAPGETVILTFDFAKIEGSPTSPVISVRVSQGTDTRTAQQLAAAMLNGPAQVQGTKVLQLVQEGLDSVFYEFECAVTGSNSQKWIHSDVLPVINPN